MKLLLWACIVCVAFARKNAGLGFLWL
uniref:Proline rich 27 n=1 Tax=Homo sapiens TaxID=9606 RepID=D6RGD6_HUMAN